MNIDWISKLRHLLQVMAFCLVVATLQYAFRPDRSYATPVVYSMFIGLITWLCIDLGRDLFPSSAETGWPKGIAGVALVVGGIVVGWFFGNLVANQVCLYYGFYPPSPAPPGDGNEFRNSVLITVVAGVVCSYYFYSINRSSYLERKMGEARRQADDARLKVLETQLEPHMLFNTLANLRALISVDPERAQTMLDHMIAYLRATLSASRSTTHPLQAEFDRLHDYLVLMSIRMGQRLAFTLALPPELAQLPVPALMLQPIVENSIKHGLEPKLEGGRIDVSARREGGELVLEVRDTGVGLQDNNGAPKGYGMSHVRERLGTMHGARATMDFAAAPEGGTRTIIRIPAGA
ncbi:sensor histidine kinase [Caenimonas koreensis DSM 17982]|uniref:Sensor histidine kinase n=1 Tax=Caenimonas koreensis DSM 17982 TaxID=1121255 RepID=A0A844ATN0_9BURK|nr:histidine kinase [Caenimonas koreensis]MRD47820.1 sensor histidine kinase [Caenimonas koreensis DSM 17982]